MSFRQQTMASINKPHTSFFRIILPYTLQQNKLKLPLNFVRRYGSEIASVAKLYLPNGDACKVGVEKKRKEDGNKGDEIWLSDGWGEFMEHHSISKGFFLVFKYRGCSVFDVEIFDLTTCSISYPPPYHVVVISDDGDDEKDENVGGDEMEKTLERLKESGIVTNQWLNGRIRRMYKECKKGIEDAVLASSPAHPSFILVLSSDQVEGKSRPVIPISYARDHIPDRGKTRTTTVALQMGGFGNSVKQWSVQVARGSSVSFCSVTLAQGWRQFNEDNNLGVGDVCLLHLVSPEDLVFNVSVFPAAQSTNHI